MGQLGTRSCIVQGVVESLPSPVPPSWPPGMAGGVGVRRNLLGSSCRWLPHCSPAFRSSCSHCLDPLHVPTSADTKDHSLLTPRPGPLAQSSHTRPTLLPAETLSLHLLWSFSNTPISTGLAPAHRCADLLGDLRGASAFPHPVLQRQLPFHV